MDLIKAGWGERGTVCLDGKSWLLIFFIMFSVAFVNRKLNKSELSAENPIRRNE